MESRNADLPKWRKSIGRGDKWFGVLGVLTVFLAAIEFIGVFLALIWVVFSGGGPQHLTWGDVLERLARTFVTFVAGWLLLVVADALGALAWLLDQRQDGAE